MRDTADQRGEYQRRDDHLDQAQEQHGDQVYVGCDLNPVVGQKVENQCSHHDAERHRDQDILRKPAGHILTPVSSGGCEFGRFHNRRNTVATISGLAKTFPL